MMSFKKAIIVLGSISFGFVFLMYCQSFILNICCGILIAITFLYQQGVRLYERTGVIELVRTRAHLKEIKERTFVFEPQLQDVAKAIDICLSEILSKFFIEENDEKKISLLSAAAWSISSFLDPHQEKEKDLLPSEVIREIEEENNFFRQLLHEVDGNEENFRAKRRKKDKLKLILRILECLRR